MSIQYTDALPNPAEYFRLFTSTGWNDEYQLDEDQLFAALRQSWYIVNAYDAGRLVGTGRILSDGVFHALILDMMVLPDYQGRGIGTQILQALVERCQARGIRDIQLFCARGKAGFYRKCGFTERPPDAPGMELGN